MNRCGRGGVDRGRGLGCRLRLQGCRRTAGGTAGRQRVAVVRRRPAESALLAARADRRLELQRARGGVALQDRQPRPASRIQARRHAADGQRRAVHDGGTRRAVVALDAAPASCGGSTREREGARAAASPRQLSGRGVAYWTDGRDERILYVTTGYRLVALDAKTGARIAAFGDDGIVDLKDGVVFGNGQQIDLGHRRDRRALRRRRSRTTAW